jgi:hypothetical protein
MAFNQQEQDIIKYGLQNGKSRAEVEKALSNFRNGITTKQVAPTEAKPNTLDRVVSGIQEKGNKIIEVLADESKSPLARGVEATATGFSALSSTAYNALPDDARKALDVIGGGIGKGFNFLTDKISNSKFLQEAAMSGQTGKLEEALKIASDLGLISGEILGAEAAAGTAKVVDKGITKGIDATKTTIDDLTKAIPQITDKTVQLSRTTTEKFMKLVEPKPKTVEGAAKQILQGETGDLKAGIEAIKAVDTTGVKTFKDLLGKLDEKIPTLARIVDADLALDITKRPLAQLNLVEKTLSGKPVKINPVNPALAQLKELYMKTGDKVRAANIGEIIQSAKKTGLTNFEINIVARTYGSEFGKKAFSKMGDPLTSVNAQLFENTRSQLKKLARQGIKGADAQAADELMSSIYNTENLISRNVEAVNKLTQKIQERGLAEKIGYQVAKYGNILTGGSLRGIMGGILPRGAGYKVMNALDLEEALMKNLEVINKAVVSGSEADITSAVNTIKKNASTKKSK